MAERNGSCPKVVLAVACALAAVCLSLVTDAKADMTSWLALYGGGGSVRDGRSSVGRPLMQLEIGMGTAPDRDLIVGGIVKSQTFFGRGTDWVFGVRGASGGFARGTWGVALDAGPFVRSWGSNAVGLSANLVLAAPYGIQASALFSQGSDDARALAFGLGVDLLRLSVYRTSGRSWWPNPLPAPSLSEPPR